MSNSSNIEIVEAYLGALRNKDLDSAPLADDVVVEDPLSGKRQGREAALAFLNSFLPALNALTVKRHIADGDHVATLWEADTVFGVIPIFECFHIVDGKIASAQAFLDPRPVLGGPA